MGCIYSNHRPEDAAFLDELQQVAAATPTLHFVPTMTDMAKSSRAWNGETGMIDQKMLQASARSSRADLLLGRPPGDGGGDARDAAEGRRRRGRCARRRLRRLLTRRHGAA
jgi:NAD(P)H-flavin reductase